MRSTLADSLRHDHATSLLILFLRYLENPIKPTIDLTLQIRHEGFGKLQQWKRMNMTRMLLSLHSLRFFPHLFRDSLFGPHPGDSTRPRKRHSLVISLT